MSRNGYARLSNEFWRSPAAMKMLAVNPAALGFYVAAVSYASDNLTDGLIEERVARYVLRVPQDVIDFLVDEGKWEPVETGWLIHNYAKWQNSREQIEQQAEMNRERVRRYREKRASDNDPDTCNAHVMHYTDVANAPETDMERFTVNVNQNQNQNQSSILEDGSGGEVSNRARAREASSTPTGEDEDELMGSWRPSVENVELAKQLDVDVAVLERRFRDKIARKGLAALGVKRRTVAALDATFRSWIEHEAQWAGERPKPVTQPDRPDITATRLSWCSPQVRELMTPYRDLFPPDVKGLGPGREWYEACKTVADRLNGGEPVETVKSDLTAQYDTRNAKTSPRIDEQDAT